MALKTDYTNDIFEGNRKYRLTQDAQGNTEIEDVTSYTQEGDIFGADDINATNAAVNRLDSATIILLGYSKWSDTAPYTMTVQVEGVKATDTPIGSLCLMSGVTAEQEKALKKAAGYISYFETGDGEITVTCISKRPTVDLPIQLKGV